MELEILEPLRLYLKSDEVAYAVELLLKPSRKKTVDESIDWVDQTEFRHAWLAAQEIYAAWHEQASMIWRKVWLENPKWANAGLVQLSSAEMKDEEFSEPSLETMWREDWFGGAFRTKGGKSVGLYVYADRDGAYSNVWGPDLQIIPNGWERDSEDDAEMNSVRKCRWDDTKIDVTDLSKASASVLSALAGH